MQLPLIQPQLKERNKATPTDPHRAKIELSLPEVGVVPRREYRSSRETETILCSRLAQSATVYSPRSHDGCIEFYVSLTYTSIPRLSFLPNGGEGKDASSLLPRTSRRRCNSFRGGTRAKDCAGTVVRRDARRRTAAVRSD